MSQGSRSDAAQWEAVYEWIGKEMSRGQSADAIQRALMGQGMQAEYARQAVAQVAARHSAGAVPPPVPGHLRQGGVQYAQPVVKSRVVEEAEGGGNPGKHVVMGLLWCVGGIVVTVISYQAAEPGGRYVLAYGAIIGGGIEFLYGLAGMMKQG